MSKAKDLLDLLEIDRSIPADDPDAKVLKPLFFDFLKYIRKYEPRSDLGKDLTYEGFKLLVHLHKKHTKMDPFKIKFTGSIEHGSKDKGPVLTDKEVFFKSLFNFRFSNDYKRYM